MLETLVQGVLLGGLYTLFALGQSLMFGVMRLTNTAQGDFIILGAFAVIAGVSLTGDAVAPWLVALAVLPVAFGFGYALQRYVLNGTLGKDPLPSLVVTFGLSIVIQNLLLELFSADPRAIETGGLSTQGVALGSAMSVGVLPLVVLAIALLATGALQWLFARTALGRSFRAVSDDREIAELMGLNAKKVYAFATAIAFVLIAIAGALQGMRTTVSPSDGPLLLLFAFEAVIIGGMGSFWGTLAGAMILGITQQIGFRLDPGWGIWFGHIVFLVVLVLRPQGLFPKTRG
ncbi:MULTISPECIES: branched-chain amino acid ABC transporter permease [Variovorax]|jgi:branched-chain amino acid transport system permease protein|uniref:branched-chain amino acid ABC transporter permease n=1 Tax=Variovorax TaxID=34072 RepID=UPI00086BFD60|nr:MULTISPECIES: branched-chain amino acid ABC transporter permease [Variovorax]MBN8752526.1 branched-chain amino acid ABC transporter permease [Variovorax sp.]ODU16374.1 MAG: ABC transporter permease [Variovorax sp. SCN 67-85]ODV24889.1 MAG: ABC transporter permease [Variovorax sp. SCN 67-20]OJZ10137.1 MAG: branched-chain amino acid ABC transporter permease [Variovorax sp. 67-131]UKI06762.1 branched-chain amino acid ABC transporter permease [Variovorax paradoxus]